MKVKGVYVIIYLLSMQQSVAEVFHQKLTVCSQHSKVSHHKCFFVHRSQHCSIFPLSSLIITKSLPKILQTEAFQRYPYEKDL